MNSAGTTLPQSRGATAVRIKTGAKPLKSLAANCRCFGVVEESAAPGPKPGVIGDVRTVVNASKARIASTPATRGLHLTIPPARVAPLTGTPLAGG